MEGGELELEIDGHIALQREGLAASVADGGGGEADVAGKLGSTHDRVGVNGNEEVLLVLWSGCGLGVVWIA